MSNSLNCTGCLKKNFLLPNLAFANIAVDGEKSSFIIFINNIILTVTVWCLVGYILDKFSFLKLHIAVAKLHFTITYGSGSAGRGRWLFNVTATTTT